MLGWGKDKKTERADTSAAPSAGERSTVSRPAGHAGSMSRSSVQARQAPEPVRSLEQVLVQEGAITREQLGEAMTIQKQSGEFLGQILMDLGYIEEGSLTSFLAKQCKIPHLSLLDYLIDKEIIKLIPKEVCLKYRVLPIDKMGKNLTVAMVNPLHPEALKAVKELCPDLRIKPILCANAHFKSVVEKYFGEQKKEQAPGAMAELSATSLGFAPLKSAAQEEEPAVESAPAPAPPPPSAQPAPVEPAATPEGYTGDAVLESCFQQTAESGEQPTLPVETSGGGETDDTTLMMREMVDAMRSSMHNTYAMLCRRVDLFKGLTPEVVAKVFTKGATVEFEKGHVVFNKGDVGEAMYVILNGKVVIDDGQKTLALLGQGDMFGEMALLSKEPRSARATAAETTSCLALSDEVLRRILPPETVIQLLVNIVVTLSERLRKANAD